MNVLSIDMDFISDKYAEDVKSGSFDSKNPHIKWWMYFNFKKSDRSEMDINYTNLAFIFDILNFFINKNKKIIFAINHDSILLELDKIDDRFDIINIDHHHDILYCSDCIVDVEKFNYISCGNWIWYLNFKNKINSYTWIKNKNSSIFNEGISNSKKPTNYNSFLRDELSFNIKDIDFDFIFICLSPNFIMPEHWQYFHMLRNMYEQKIGKKVEYIQKIYEIDPRHLNFDLYKDVVIENNCDVKE